MSQSRTNPLHLDPNAATLCATLRAFTLLPTHTMMYCYGSLLCCGAGGRMEIATGVAIIRLRSPDAKGPLTAPRVQALCVSAAEVAAAALLCLAAWTSACHSGGMHGSLREALGLSVWQGEV